MNALVIFDLDGTLLNTIEDLAAANNYALHALGFPQWPVEAYNTMVGRGIRNLFRASLPPDKADEGNVGRMASVFVPYYNAHICDRTAPYTGIPELLRTLQDCGVQLALASNKYQEGAETLMARCFPDIRFRKILGQREGQPIKPDPQIVFQIMAEIPQIGKEAVIYVGDSNVDMQTGANAGVKTVGVTWGFRTEGELRACGPWRIVGDAGELLRAISEGLGLGIAG